MQPQTYMERARLVVEDAGIAAMVLLNESNTDAEFLMLRPRLTPENELITPEAFTARKLRSVGVVALNERGLPQAAFKESLEASVVGAIASAFREYVRVLLAEKLIEQIAAAEIAELDRLFRLPDTRSNPN